MLSQEERDELLISIHDKICKMPDRNDLNKAKREIIKEFHTDKKSEIDLQGPSSNVRRSQIKKVRRLLFEAYENQVTKTLSQICLEAWEPLKGGYPTPKALYNYCHEHEDMF